MKYKQFNSIKTTLTFLVAIILFSLNNLFSQVHYHFDFAKSIISAEADNYFPKINENVKISLEIKAPFEILNSENLVGFVFNAEDEVQIVKGEQWVKKSFEKDELFQMEITVKFTKKKVCNINAYFNKNTYVMLSFYVDGVYRESKEVKHIRKNIEALKKFIDNSKQELDVFFPTTIGKYPDKVKDHFVFTINDYDKSVLEKSKKWNATIFKDLKNEYDSLYKSARKIEKGKYKKSNGTSNSQKKSSSRSKNEIIERSPRTSSIANTENTDF
ncbi:MAG: hypothetical protein L3J41_04850 [Melioribacteraceae bacterium]|nr:hypothetical protein [Melioribacteraceae bacterium]